MAPAQWFSRCFLNSLTLPWDFLICLSGTFSAQFTLGDAFMTPPPSKTHTGPHCSLVPYLALFFFMVFYSTSNHSVFCLLVNCSSLQIECKFHEGRRFICHVHCAAFVTGPVPRNFLFCTGLWVYEWMASQKLHQRAFLTAFYKWKTET